MGIHIGNKIQEEVYRQGISVTLFAKKISRSRNVVYDIFSRESVDTELLNKIGKILNYDFFSLYSAQREYVQEGFKTFAQDPRAAYGADAGKLSQLQQENQVLKNEVEYLKKIIALLEKKDTKPPKK